MRAPGLAALAELPGVTVFPLDVTDARSVHELAGRIGAKVEILVNNGYHLRPGGIRGRKDVNTPRAEMDVHYFGLLRLAAEFGPAPARARRRRAVRRLRVGQRAVDLRAREPPGVRDVLGLPRGRLVSLAVPPGATSSKAG